MDISTDLSFITLIAEASLVVQLVMLILVMISLVSWATIFKKWAVLKRTKKQADKFEEEFWSGGDLNTLFQRAGMRRNEAGPLERIFEAGMSEFLRARDKKGLAADALLGP